MTKDSIPATAAEDLATLAARWQGSYPAAAARAMARAVAPGYGLDSDAAEAVVAAVYGEGAPAPPAAPAKPLRQIDDDGLLAGVAAAGMRLRWNVIQRRPEAQIDGKWLPVDKAGWPRHELMNRVSKVQSGPEGGPWRIKGGNLADELITVAARRSEIHEGEGSPGFEAALRWLSSPTVAGRKCVHTDDILAGAALVHRWESSPAAVPGDDPRRADCREAARAVGRVWKQGRVQGAAGRRWWRWYLPSSHPVTGGESDPCDG